MKKIILILLVVLMALPPVYGTSNAISVSLPNFNITINGMQIDNRTEKYPFILYKGITYFPMTWDFSNALGLKLTYSDEMGLNVSKNTTMTIYQQKNFSTNKSTGTYSASIVNFPVVVNGKTIDNSKEVYPLLSFRGITYFPMTYAFMVNEFGTGYNWNNETGLSVSADEKLEVRIPESEVFTFATSKSEIISKKALTKDMVYVKASDKYQSGYEIQYYTGFDKKYDGYLISSEADVYDTDGTYAFTTSILTPQVYEAKANLSDPFVITLIDSAIEYDQFVIKTTLTHPSAALADIKYNHSDVSYTYFNNDLSVDDILALNPYYIDTTQLSVGNKIVESLIPYMAYYSERKKTRFGESATTYTNAKGENIEFDYAENLQLFSLVSDIYVDQTEPIFDLIIKVGSLYTKYNFSDTIRLYDESGHLFHIFINEAKYK